MKVYLIYDMDEHEYLHVNTDVDETVTACCSSYDKAVDFLKKYMYKYHLIRNEGNHFTYYDPDDDYEMDFFIEEVDVL